MILVKGAIFPSSISIPSFCSNKVMRFFIKIVGGTSSIDNLELKRPLTTLSFIGYNTSPNLPISTKFDDSNSLNAMFIFTLEDSKLIIFFSSWDIINPFC
jgi:hypothetical protein